MFRGRVNLRTPIYIPYRFSISDPYVAHLRTPAIQTPNVAQMRVCLVESPGAPLWYCLQGSRKETTSFPGKCILAIIWNGDIIST